MNRMDFLFKNSNLSLERLNLGEIPIIRIYNKSKPGPAIVFYHGWGSSKESQVFRAWTLANLGFQLILPDANFHGERNPINYEKETSGVKYFWKIIFQNISEWPVIKSYIREDLGVPSEKIGLIGHSMGAISVSGIFTGDRGLSCGVLLNGSMDWEKTNEYFAKKLNMDMNLMEDYDKKRLIELSPRNNISSLEDRNLLILHGGADPLVSIQGNLDFIGDFGDSLKGIKLKDYKGLGHFVTTNMLEDAARYFSEKIGD